MWPVGQVVKTAASHAANGSSTLPRVTTPKKAELFWGPQEISTLAAAAKPPLALPDFRRGDETKSGKNSCGKAE